jgi:RNA polymerase sigma factor (sigma-70 family)
MGEMQPKSDAQLLREYAESGSESAFTELVTRHTDLVYSAALRQVSSSDLACDVAQNVFTSLARGAGTLAGKLNPDASLAGWLCRCTRNLALNLRRDDFRRHSRERQAMENLHPSPETAPDWGRLCPLLDEAISGLNEADHDALVLRFFKNQDLRAVGLALGVSDDTAQKRVSRALEKLREYLAHHGITTTGAALAMAISANAVQSAPVGLAVMISTAAVLAGTAVSTSTLIAATKTIAMTTLQKTVITAALAIVAGAGIYEARQAAQLREQNQTLQQAQAPLAEQIQQLQRERADMTNRLAALQAENAKLKSGQNTAELLKLRGDVAQLRHEVNDPTDASAKALVAKMNKLKQRLAETPNAKIPELQFVTEQDWLNAANGKLDTDADYRRALASLRSAAESKVASMLQKALRAYLQSNSGQMPTDLGQLQPYFDSPVDDAILQRWEIAPAATVTSLGLGGDVIITQKAPVDDVFDTRYGIGPNGSGSTGFLPNETFETMKPVFDAYRAAHNGQWQTEMSQLLPYATTPEQQTALQKLILKNSAGN